MRRLVLAVSLTIAMTILTLFLSNASGFVAGINGVGGVHPQFSTSTVKATETLTPAIYLPFVSRNFPPVIRVPEGKYLFVEYWTRDVLGEGCHPLCVDFPTYSFDPQSGVLYLWLGNPVLGDDDIGYIGSGLSLHGEGCGASSRLSTVQSLPFSLDGTTMPSLVNPHEDITLHHVDETGAVTLEREGEVIILDAGEAWVSDEEIRTWYEGCIVTTTHYITNYAFQDRDRIIYD